MGIFFEQIEIVNRTSRALNVRFDGQDITIPPNYTAEGTRIEGVHTMVPKQVMPFALNQNVVMGSEELEDPSDFRSLVGFIDRKDRKPKSWHDISFVPVDDQGLDSMTRVPISAVTEDDPEVRQVLVRGRKIDGKLKLPSADNGGTLSPRAS